MVLIEIAKVIDGIYQNDYFSLPWRLHSEITL
jgi:hypothetical protein